MQFIVDELFVGNKLAAGEIQTSDGTAIDLRNIRSPIVVFCSKGDNITPPQQALGLDSRPLRRRRRDPLLRPDHRLHDPRDRRPSRHLRLRRRRAQGARRVLQQHRPDRRAAARPLRGGVRRKDAPTPTNPDLVTGEWVMRCEARTLDDIRALGGNDAADERRFATAARVSEINLALYRTFVQPFVRAMVNPPMAEWMQQHASAAAAIRDVLRRQSVHGAGRGRWPSRCARTASRSAADNPFLALQETCLAADRRRRSTPGATCSETLAERTFLAIYGSPALQAAVGIDPGSTRSRCARRRRARCIASCCRARIAELQVAHRRRRPARSPGPRAALCRHGARRRSTSAASSDPPHPARDDGHAALPLAEFKALVREQFFMLLIDQEAALAAIPALLPADAEDAPQGARPRSGRC